VNRIARFLARRLWWSMLWLMRRRWMRRLQQAAISLSPEGPKRDRARESLLEQERLARRWGLPLLTFSIRMLMLSILLTLLWNLYWEAEARDAFEFIREIPTAAESRRQD
jgi:hypothetical protein